MNNWKKALGLLLVLLCAVGMTACKETAAEGPVQEEEAVTEEKISAPSKEEVLSVRETVLEGMSEEETDRLTENIKTANLQMESAYLNENIFEKLEDKESLLWNYFDETGDIQIGWAHERTVAEMNQIRKEEDLTEQEYYEKYGEPVYRYNRFDAENFAKLLEDMNTSVQNELLSQDLQRLIELTRSAADTHEAEYANEIYKILHDLDYFLLRYGPEDVGQYTQDDSTVQKYYGVLSVYEAKEKVENPYK